MTLLDANLENYSRCLNLSQAVVLSYDSLQKENSYAGPKILIAKLCRENSNQ